MNTAAKGRRLEHEIRELFQSAGYSVLRGAGSKGTMFGVKTDLVATKATRSGKRSIFIRAIGIQCKVKGKKGKGV